MVHAVSLTGGDIADAAHRSLERRAELQGALAELARLALAALGREQLLDAVSGVIAETLGADGPAVRVAVARVRPDADAPVTLGAAIGGGFTEDERAVLYGAADVLAAALRRGDREEQARHETRHDALTGLPNRTLFLETLRTALAGSVATGRTVAVLNLDLDRFGVVNETLGNERGDELLIAVARRLSGALGAGQTLARISGDEFAIVCEDSAGERGAMALAEQVLRTLRPPIGLDEREVYCDASIGVAVATGRAHDADALLCDAQVAMYRAKERGGRYELFDRAMRRRTLERLDLESDLRRALDQSEFELHYQPIVSLEQQRIVGLEALVRWRHPERGLVPPGAFIPLAEESGLILPLGRWVLQEACRQLARWSAEPDIDVPYVSVNLSARQLAQPDLPEEIAELLRVTGVLPEQLALELTESVLMEETDSPTAVVERLKALGVRLLLDDFGTGYSSLNYVKRFPIEAIKIDRAFVAGVADDESDRHILRAIVSMAAGFDVELVAEGVETTEQARRLRQLGIGLVQGYGFGRPVPVPATEALLREGLPLDRLADAFEPPDTDELRSATERPAARKEDDEPAMTLGEAADALEVSTSTLRRWADAGRIRTLRTSGGHRRFAIREVQRLSSARSAGRRPAVRAVPPPVEPLPRLAELLAAIAGSVGPSAARAVYEHGHAGWFATPTGCRHVERWALRVAAAARSADYEQAGEATRKLVLQATVAGTSLLERQTMLERLGEIATRELQSREPDRGRLLAARRLLVRLRQLGLESLSA
jgi:diguanylate cyclase (GGDEF)-like protein/excisionase family DNA binding protein